MKEGNQPTKEDSLKNVIDSSDIGRRELAKRVGVSLSTLTYWIAGEKVPRTDHFLRMAKELNVSLDELAQSMGYDITGIPKSRRKKINP